MSPTTQKDEQETLFRQRGRRVVRALWRGRSHCGRTDTNADRVLPTPICPAIQLFLQMTVFLRCADTSGHEVLGQNYHFLMGGGHYGCTRLRSCRAGADRCRVLGRLWRHVPGGLLLSQGRRHVLGHYLRGPGADSDGQVAQHFGVVSRPIPLGASRTRKRAKLLLAELDHRVKNTLATVQAIARLEPVAAIRRSESRCRGPSRDVFWRSPMPTHYLRAKAGKGHVSAR